MENQQRDEKDILEILTSFEIELEEKLQESKCEIERVKYYEKFNMNDIEFRNIFITTEKDEKGKITTHVYCGDSSNELFEIDAEGKIYLKNSDLGKYLDEIDLDKVMEENEKEPGRLKGMSEKATPEEMKKALKGEKESEKEQDEDIQTEEIEADLEEQGEDLKISEYKQIKDSYISERMPEVFKDGEENGIAYSNKLNRFVIISKVNGQYQINENVEPARMTWRTIISISPDGNQVERKVPHALMQLPNNDEKEIAVTLDEYGDASIETVEVLPCQERISREVRTEGEGIEKEETLEMRREFETQGKEYSHDIVHQVRDIEQAQRDENKTVDYEISPDDYIPNTDKTWGELMDETGDSLPKLIERYENDMRGRAPEESQEVVEEIETDYGMVNRERPY